MAHYAFLDENNIVTEVIVGKEESNFDWEQQYGSFRGQVCKRTSFNTIGGVHQLGGTQFRKNYAGVGFIYDYERDAFIPPKPFDSWVLNDETCLWDSPIPYPADGVYNWDELTLSWVEITQE
jgi:outer membrane protease